MGPEAIVEGGSFSPSRGRLFEQAPRSTHHRQEHNRGSLSVVPPANEQTPQRYTCKAGFAGAVVGNFLFNSD